MKCFCSTFLAVLLGVLLGGAGLVYAVHHCPWLSDVPVQMHKGPAKPKACQCNGKCTCGADCHCNAMKKCSDDCTCCGCSDACKCGKDCHCHGKKHCNDACKCEKKAAKTGCPDCEK